METLTATATCRLATIAIATERPTQFVDLTDRLESFVADSGIRLGLLNVQTLHTTTAVVVNEHEPLLLADFATLLEDMAPGHSGYRHDDLSRRTVNLTLGERPNGHAHCRRCCCRPRCASTSWTAGCSWAAGSASSSPTSTAAQPPGDGDALRRGALTVRVKMILPALTEATSPFFRPIKYSLFPPLGLATLAAYLDPDDEIDLQDEHVERPDLDDTPDLVVIQVYITSANRAYRLADEYRRRGAHVALGGLHVTSLPEEAAAHADTIFLGPGEDTWPQFLRTTARGGRDASTSRARARWWAAADPPRSDQAPAVSRPNSIVVSRGCPHVCDFCYKEAFFEGGKSFYTQTVDDCAGRRSTACPAAISTSSTITCSATAASPARSSTACAAWAACGRPPAR
jgi:thiamine phosphate synthase YjbQ (UPF0047 family)